MTIETADTTSVLDARISSSCCRASEKSQLFWSPRHFREEAAPFNIDQATINELAEAHLLAEDLVRTRMAPLSALLTAHMRTAGSAWIYRDTKKAVITGVLLTLPLNGLGEKAMNANTFNPLSPDLKHLCAPGDAISAMYIWFAGGLGLRARGAVVRTALAWRDGAYSGLRGYSRAATDAGARGLETHGFGHLQPSGLMLCPERT